MAAAAAGVEVDIPLVELFLAELFVEESERVHETKFHVPLHQGGSGTPTNYVI